MIVLRVHFADHVHPQGREDFYYKDDRNIQGLAQEVYAMIEAQKPVVIPLEGWTQAVIIPCSAIKYVEVWQEEAADERGSEVPAPGLSEDSRPDDASLVD